MELTLSASSTLTITYGCDPLERLTAADYSDGSFFHYSYDAAGNRLSETTQAESNLYTYANANRIVYAIVDTHCIFHPIANTNGFLHAVPDAHCFLHPVADANRVLHADKYTHCISIAVADEHLDTHAYQHGDRNANRDGHVYTQPATDSHKHSCAAGDEYTYP
jgi:YD repeat-containing protein